MIRWALVTVWVAPMVSVSLSHIYDSPDDCSAGQVRTHFIGGEGYMDCVEIDGNKSPEPQIQKAKPTAAEAKRVAQMLRSMHSPRQSERVR